MPERMIDLLFRFLHQNEGCLSATARRKEFSKLKDAETNRIEAAYRDIFAGNGLMDVE